MEALINILWVKSKITKCCHDLEAGLRRRSTNCAKLSTIKSGVTVACRSSSGLYVLSSNDNKDKRLQITEISYHVRLAVMCCIAIWLWVIFPSKLPSTTYLFVQNNMQQLPYLYFPVLTSTPARPHL